MKETFKSPARLASALALGAFILTSSSGCSTKDVPSCCAKIEPAAAFTDKSLFQVESKWTTDASAEIRLSALGGKPQVLVMFFANCQFACPLLVNDVKRIEAAMPENLCGKINFTLVSFDTKRDTVDVLAGYRKAHELSAPCWTLLRGELDDVLELAALLGVKFKQDARGDFAHSNIITILNAQGEIVHQQIGLGQDVSETVRILKSLVAK